MSAPDAYQVSGPISAEDTGHTGRQFRECPDCRREVMTEVGALTVELLAARRSVWRTLGGGLLVTPEAAAAASLSAHLVPVIVSRTMATSERPQLFQVRPTTTVRAAESSRESSCPRCGISQRLRLHPLLLEAVPTGDWSVASLTDNPSILIFAPKTQVALADLAPELEFEPVYVQGTFEPEANAWIDIGDDY